MEAGRESRIRGEVTVARNYIPRVDAQQTSSMNTRQEFGYIIVGARSAGCVAMDLFAQANLSKVRRVLPASDKEADIVAFIEQRTGANYHTACTCAIGRVVRLRSPGFRH